MYSYLLSILLNKIAPLFKLLIIKKFTTLSFCGHQIGLMYLLFHLNQLRKKLFKKWLINIMEEERL